MSIYPSGLPGGQPSGLPLRGEESARRIEQTTIGPGTVAMELQQTRRAIQIADAICSLRFEMWVRKVEKTFEEYFLSFKSCFHSTTMHHDPLSSSVSVAHQSSSLLQQPHQPNDFFELELPNFLNRVRQASDREIERCGKNMHHIKKCFERKAEKLKCDHHSTEEDGTAAGTGYGNQEVDSPIQQRSKVAELVRETLQSVRRHCSIFSPKEKDEDASDENKLSKHMIFVAEQVEAVLRARFNPGGFVHDQEPSTSLKPAGLPGFSREHELYRGSQDSDDEDEEVLLLSATSTIPAPHLAPPPPPPPSRAPPPPLLPPSSSSVETTDHTSHHRHSGDISEGEAAVSNDADNDEVSSIRRGGGNNSEKINIEMHGLSGRSGGGTSGEGEGGGETASDNDEMLRKIVIDVFVAGDDDRRDKPLTAIFKEVQSRHHDGSVTRQDVNRVLYGLQKEKMVDKVVESPPIWRLLHHEPSRALASIVEEEQQFDAPVEIQQHQHREEVKGGQPQVQGLLYLICLRGYLPCDEDDKAASTMLQRASVFFSASVADASSLIVTYADTLEQYEMHLSRAVALGAVAALGGGGHSHGVASIAVCYVGDLDTSPSSRGDASKKPEILAILRTSSSSSASASSTSSPKTDSSGAPSSVSTSTAAAREQVATTERTKKTPFLHSLWEACKKISAVCNGMCFILQHPLLMCNQGVCAATGRQTTTTRSRSPPSSTSIPSSSTATTASTEKQVSSQVSPLPSSNSNPTTTIGIGGGAGAGGCSSSSSSSSIISNSNAATTMVDISHLNDVLRPDIVRPALGALCGSCSRSEHSPDDHGDLLLVFPTIHGVEVGDSKSRSGGGSGIEGKGGQAAVDGSGGDDRLQTNKTTDDSSSSSSSSQPQPNKQQQQPQMLLPISPVPALGRNVLTDFHNIFFSTFHAALEDGRLCGWGDLEEARLVIDRELAERRIPMRLSLVCNRDQDEHCHSACSQELVVREHQHPHGHHHHGGHGHHHHSHSGTGSGKPYNTKYHLHLNANQPCPASASKRNTKTGATGSSSSSSQSCYQQVPSVNQHNHKHPLYWPFGSGPEGTLRALLTHAFDHHCIEVLSQFRLGGSGGSMSHPSSAAGHNLTSGSGLQGQGRTKKQQQQLLLQQQRQQPQPPLPQLQARSKSQNQSSVGSEVSYYGTNMGPRITSTGSTGSGVQLRQGAPPAAPPPPPSQPPTITAAEPPSVAGVVGSGKRRTEQRLKNGSEKSELLAATVGDELSPFAFTFDLAGAMGLQEPVNKDGMSRSQEKVVSQALQDLQHLQEGKTETGEEIPSLEVDEVDSLVRQAVFDLFFHEPMTSYGTKHRISHILREVQTKISGVNPSRSDVYRTLSVLENEGMAETVDGEWWQFVLPTSPPSFDDTMQSASASAQPPRTMTVPKPVLNAVSITSPPTAPPPPPERNLKSFPESHFSPEPFFSDLHTPTSPTACGCENDCEGTACATDIVSNILLQLRAGGGGGGFEEDEGGVPTKKNSTPGSLLGDVVGGGAAASSGAAATAAREAGYAPLPANTMYCEVCEVHVCGVQNWQQHLESERHTRKAVRKAAEQRLSGGKPIPNPEASRILNPDNFYHCDACNVSISGPSNWKQHVEGKQHTKSLKRLAKQQS